MAHEIEEFPETEKSNEEILNILSVVNSFPVIEKLPGDSSAKNPYISVNKLF
jgi:hypothetical protein